MPPSSIVSISDTAEYNIEASSLFLLSPCIVEVGIGDPLFSAYIIDKTPKGDD